MKKSNTWSFWNGWLEIPPVRRKEVRNAIMTALELNCRGAWYDRINGRTEPKVSEKTAIEDLFKSYNVPLSKVWGDNRDTNEN